MLLGEPEQQCVELCSLLAAQGGEELVLELARQAAEAFECLASRGGHADELASAVVGVSAALDQAGVLELVEKPDELALVVAEGVRDRALRRQRAFVEDGEDRVVVGWRPASL